MMACVTANGRVAEALAVTNGVKQDCVLAPTLFILMFSVLLMDTYHDQHPGIHVPYRIVGHLIDRRRMQIPSLVSTTTVHNLLLADYSTLNTATEEGMQRRMDLFATGCANFTLKKGDPAPTVAQRKMQCTANQC
ncbi:unnamed protein product [Schistocephalus solidus]|uniref:Reverse transcriptase domain-containing protein n=1 Tax=Schistocephalus solidus TaxID=70667 RepID=A0A183SSG0_SCHSO|nr:unnamed protein product [Schistocephalus solidus]